VCYLISAKPRLGIKRVAHGLRTARTHLRASVCIPFLHLR